MGFDLYIMLAKNSPDALDWANFPREWRRPVSCPFETIETTLPLAGMIRSGVHLCSACLYPRATAAPGLEQQQQQAAGEAGSSRKFFL